MLGDLLEACRVIAFAAAPFMPAAAARAASQLGVGYDYDDDGNGGPALQELASWGALEPGGSIGAAEPLFPRLETDEAEGEARGVEEAPMAIGEITHIELPSDDPERAQTFYSELFGWPMRQVEGMPDYTMFQSGPGEFGGAIGKRGVSAPDRCASTSRSSRSM